MTQTNFTDILSHGPFFDVQKSEVTFLTRSRGTLFMVKITMNDFNGQFVDYHNVEVSCMDHDLIDNNAHQSARGRYKEVLGAAKQSVRQAELSSVLSSTARKAKTLSNSNLFEEQTGTYRKLLVLMKPDESGASDSTVVLNQSKITECPFILINPVGDNKPPRLIYPGLVIDSSDPISNLVRRYTARVSTIYVPISVYGHEKFMYIYLPLGCSNYIENTVPKTLLKNRERYMGGEHVPAVLPYVDQGLTLAEYKQGRLIMTQELSMRLLYGLINGKATTVLSELFMMGGARMNMNDVEMKNLTERALKSKNFITALKFLSAFSSLEHVIIDTFTRQSAVNVITYISSFLDNLRTERDLYDLRIQDLENGRSTNLQYYKNQLDTITDLVLLKNEHAKLVENYQKFRVRAIHAAVSLAEDIYVRQDVDTSYKRLSKHVFVDDRLSYDDHLRIDEETGFCFSDAGNFLRILNAPEKLVSGPKRTGVVYTLNVSSRGVQINGGGKDYSFPFGENTFALKKVTNSSSFKEIVEWICGMTFNDDSDLSAVRISLPDHFPMYKDIGLIDSLITTRAVALSINPATMFSENFLNTNAAVKDNLERLFARNGKTQADTFFKNSVDMLAAKVRNELNTPVGSRPQFPTTTQESPVQPSPTQSSPARSSLSPEEKEREEREENERKDRERKKRERERKKPTTKAAAKPVQVDQNGATRNEALGMLKTALNLTGNNSVGMIKGAFQKVSEISFGDEQIKEIQLFIDKLLDKFRYGDARSLADELAKIIVSSDCDFTEQKPILDKIAWFYNLVSCRFKFDHPVSANKCTVSEYMMIILETIKSMLGDLAKKISNEQAKTLISKCLSEFSSVHSFESKYRIIKKLQDELEKLHDKDLLDGESKRVTSLLADIGVEKSKAETPARQGGEGEEVVDDSLIEKLDGAVAHVLENGVTSKDFYNRYRDNLSPSSPLSSKSPSDGSKFSSEEIDSLFNSMMGQKERPSRLIENASKYAQMIMFSYFRRISHHSMIMPAQLTIGDIIELDSLMGIRHLDSTPANNGDNVTRSFFNRVSELIEDMPMDFPVYEFSVIDTPEIMRILGDIKRNSETQGYDRNELRKEIRSLGGLLTRKMDVLRNQPFISKNFHAGIREATKHMGKIKAVVLVKAKIDSLA